MNERIKEISNQAKIWAMENTIFPISSHIPSGYTEKFAELIVEECINQFIQGGAIGADGTIVKYVKKHFGLQ